MFERSTWQGVEGGLQLIATEVLSPTILNELNPVNNCMSTVGSCLFHSWNCRWDHSHGCDHNLEKDLDMEDSPGKNTGVGCHFLLQGVFPTHESNLCLLLGRWVLYHWATREAPPRDVRIKFEIFICNQSVQFLSCVHLFATPWTAAHQASLSNINPQSSLKLMSIELVMSCTHLILYYSLLFLLSISPSITVFSKESVLHIRWPKYWRFSVSIILPMNI